MPSSDQFPVDTALNLLKEGNVQKAKVELNITEDAISDDEFTQCMVALENGLTLFAQARHPEAVEQFRTANPIIQHTTDKEVATVLQTMANFAEGVTKLMKGDAFGASELIDVSQKTIEQMSFFGPGLEKAAHSFKAISYISLARAALNAGDVAGAESLFGQAKDQHEQLLALLNPDNAEDIIHYVDVFGLRVEVINFFALLDLQSIDLDEMEQRLVSAKDDLILLQKYHKQMPDGIIKKSISLIIIMYFTLEDILHLERDIIFGRSPANKSNLEKLKRVDQNLFEARELAKTVGDRGKIYLYSIHQLDKLQENLLKIGKIGKEDFGRFAGPISFASLIIMVIVVQLTIKPTGYTALFYFLGELVIALIVGFGYGALKFRPLLKLFSEVVKSSGKT